MPLNSGHYRCLQFDPGIHLNDLSKKMRPPHFRVLMLLATTFAMACDGTRPVATDIPLLATTRELYTLGGADVPDWQAFVEISEVHFDGAENVVLVDRRQPRIAVAGPDGEFRHFVSRAGDGPGELRSVVRAVVLRDDRIVVVDAGHGGLLLFDADGEFVDQYGFDDRSRMLPLPGQTTPTRSMMVSATGFPTFLGTLPDNRLLARGSDTRTLEIHTLGQQSAVELHRAHDPSAGTVREGNGTSVRVGDMQVSLPNSLLPRTLAFAPPLVAGVLSDGRIAVVDSVGYHVKILRADGAVDAVLERSIKPMPVTPGMREAARRRQLTGGGTTVIATGPNLTSSEEEALSTLLMESMAPMMEYASEVPVIDDIAVDSEDRIWVSRTGGDGVSRGPTDVLTADGDYLGTLAADEFRFPNAFGSNGLMAYMELDELDVATVRVVRLVSLLPPASVATRGSVSRTSSR